MSYIGNFAKESMSYIVNFTKAYFLFNGHASGMNEKNLLPAVPIRNSNLYLTVKPSASTESFIDGVRAVCSSNYNYCAPGLKPVHQGQQLSNHPAFHFPGDFTSFRGYGIDFIYEDDGRCVLLSLLEYLTKFVLAFSIILGNDLRTTDSDAVSYTHLTLPTIERCRSWRSA